MLNRRRVLTAGAFAFAALGSKPVRSAMFDIATPNATDLSFTAQAASRSTGDTVISVQDSPLQTALDVYYEFLAGIAEANGGTTNKLVVNNTITSFDISTDTPYYNDGLFRAFADRVYLSSPEGFGTAFKADRFSVHFERLVRTAASGIDGKYKDIMPTVRALQKEMSLETTALSNRVSEISENWSKLSTSLGLTNTDSDYEMKFISYLESIRYADQIKQYSINIDSILTSIDAVRRSAYTPSEQLLLDVMAQLTDTRKVARPLRPQFERSVPDVNELTFANPLARVEAVCDIAPGAYPMGDLVKFLQVDGVKDVEITKGKESLVKHEKDWSASGGGSFSFGFFSIGGGAGGSGHSSFVESIKKTSSLHLSFQNIAEVLVDRGIWFDPAIFTDMELAKTLSRIPSYERLQYVPVSLIIGRGLTLKLRFDDSISTESWSKQSFSASGGVSIFGFGLGGRGGNSRYDYDLEIDTDGKGVKFIDHPQMTRILAVRVEELAKVTPESALQRAVAFRVFDDSKISEFNQGKINYLQLQTAKLKALSK
ncbi:hypothetical protein GOB18_07860 [Sinorhizobium meliloti]|nr:hypothetical protein [Sinorhizobium meliloti]MDW9453680.1 hypothetical protein [Sinorhizobium meliloti]